MRVKYNFDEIFDRTGTSSVKYDLREMYFGSADVIPMWVADMDFETPHFIREAIQARANHPIYGYSYRSENYFNTIIEWFKSRHNWSIKKEWIVFSPGIVPALNMVVLALTQENDQIIVQPPVYFPFFTAVTEHKRKLIHNQLIVRNGTYSINFEQLEMQAKTARMLLLCSPHNPVGRSWSKVELERLAEICIKNSLIVLSDEIHADLVLPGHTHQVLANLSPEIAELTITAHAPSKTFNLAGLSTSSLIISNESILQKVSGLYDRMHVGHGNLFGIVASEAAFKHGAQWLNAMLAYIDANVDMVMEFVKNNLPRIKAYRPEATYMIWLDFNDYKLDDEALQKQMVEKAGLGLSPGKVFGPGGEGFMRMNLACPRQMVRNALDCLLKVFGS
jgi:cystathionine beta-lyase